jgi:hypothetical protein
MNGRLLGSPQSYPKAAGIIVLVGLVGQLEPKLFLELGTQRAVPLYEWRRAPSVCTPLLSVETLSGASVDFAADRLNESEQNWPTYRVSRGGLPASGPAMKACKETRKRFR